MEEITITTETRLRLQKIRKQMVKAGAEALLLADNSNIYYLSGRVFRGYIFVPAKGDPLFFVIRPTNLKGEQVIPIRKPEQIAEHVQTLGIEVPQAFGLELDDLPYSDILRLQKALGLIEPPLNASRLLKEARAVKTPLEISLIEEDGRHQMMAYSRVPHIYKEEMTDIELQIELERILRLEGCLGYYRTSGRLMEIGMGSVLCGDNADVPTPYDFAVGGGGASHSLPVGADGRTMRPGTTVMIDMCGNFNGYQSDMTRVWSLGHCPDRAREVHEVAREILRTLEKSSLPGTPVAALYDSAMQIVHAHNLEKYFMGHTQQASFIGHGVGIQLNELPVITPRSPHILEEGMVLAIEPKFVLPHIGAVGLENTYVVTPTGLRNLTPFPEEITDLTA